MSFFKEMGDVSEFRLGDTLKEDGESQEFNSYGALLQALHSQARIVLIEGPSGTGKSRGGAELIHLLCEEIPGVRAAFIRKKRVDATESILQVYEDWVLPPGHPCLKGPQRAYRRMYKYPNDSEIHVFGLSDRSGNESGAEKLKSTAWDILLFEEATEMSMDDCLVAKTRLRSSVIAKPRILMPFNPSVEQHWIYTLIGQPDVEHFHTIHHDNPRYWVEKTGGNVVHPLTGKEGEWTPKGLDYIENNLAMLPEGPMRDRFFLGQRVKPSGIVYPEFDFSRNVSNVPFLQEEFLLNMEPEDAEKYVRDNFSLYIGCDWGKVHPAVIQMWIKDGLGKSRMIKEFYRTGVVTDKAAEEFVNYFGWEYDEDFGGRRSIDMPEFGFYFPLYNEDGTPNFEAVSDHDPESRSLFERATGVEPELAFKGKDIGIPTVKIFLRDGILVYDQVEAIGGDDIEQSRKFKPTSTISEVLKYRVNEKTGKPIPIDDDGFSASRYYATYAYGVTDIKLMAKDVSNRYSSNPDNFTAVKMVDEKQRDVFGYGHMSEAKEDRCLYGGDVMGKFERDYYDEL